MRASLQCLSHTPVMNKVALTPEVDVGLRAALSEARARAVSFAPDLIIIFAPDHFNGVLHDMMPPFCIGAAAQALGDYGTPTGPLPVSEALAVRCAHAVMGDGVDIAVSHRLRVDHGFTQTLQLLTGGIDTVSVLPVFVNCIAPPLASPRRARLLGQAIGGFLAKERPAERVLIVGSGGMSHDPPLLPLERASADLRERMIQGRQRTPAEQRLQELRVVGAARRFADMDPEVGGSEVSKPLNPDWDRRMLALLCSGDFEALDALTDEDIIAEAGNGGHELRTWIAAAACLRAIGTSDMHVDYYRAIPNWMAGFAIAHGSVELSASSPTL